MKIKAGKSNLLVQGGGFICGVVIMVLVSALFGGCSSKKPEDYTLKEAEIVVDTIKNLVYAYEIFYTESGETHYHSLE